MQKMISVEEALGKILSFVSVLPAEEKPILECLDQVIDEDVYSPYDAPPLDNSAMDGYAVRSTDTRGAGPSSPKMLKVIEEVPAGSMPTRKVTPGTAVRIMTGGPIPEGSDAVVQFEDTDEIERTRGGGHPQAIGILKEARPGLNIRSAGEDIKKGALVIKKGAVLRPAEIGVLATVGRAAARVIRRPVVAVLATGDELVDVGQPLPPGKIHNSNTYSVAAQVKRYGGIPRVLGIARDNVEHLIASIRSGLDTDMVLTSGGVSAGDYDMVKNVLAREGEISFWTVRMKPGKPIAFGVFRVNGKKERIIPHLGFPGNPVSTMVSFELFARTAILKMMGKTTLEKPWVMARMADRVMNRDGRRVYARVIVSRTNGGYLARLTGEQGSAILTSMALADGLAVIPEDVTEVKEGDTVKVLMLDWNESRI
ncbi:MAG: molybdopterin molybdotransferase MoeA [Chloroflexi bacterium]|nr:molybdopterin molybdotransferase MoeA [Chloroflexota bacterium]